MDDLMRISKDAISIVHKIEKIKERMCDDYCRIPREFKDSDYIEEVCRKCPLNLL